MACTAPPRPPCSLGSPLSPGLVKWFIIAMCNCSITSHILAVSRYILQAVRREQQSCFNKHVDSEQKIVNGLSSHAEFLFCFLPWVNLISVITSHVTCRSKTGIQYFQIDCYGKNIILINKFEAYHAFRNVTYKILRFLIRSICF